MKGRKTNKTMKVVKRSSLITMEDVLNKGVLVENGRGRVPFRPSLEIVGRKFGELIKTRTPARKRIIGGKAKVAKPVKKAVDRG